MGMELFSAAFRIRTDFNLGKNLSKRPFLLELNGSLERKIFFNGRVARVSVSQRGKNLTISSSTRETLDALSEKLKWCLGVDEDFSPFYELCRDDPVLSLLLPEIRGLRIFSAPSDWETLVCILASQMTSFPQYKRMVYSLYNAYGLFPSERDVLARPSLLRKCGLGYRAKFVHSSAKKFSGSVEGLPGVGPYSRNIFALFGRRDFSAVYDDVLIRRILKEKYSGESLDEFSARWGEWAGVAEVYLQKFLADQG
jgi:3-methyladenine DNA glycosylase/8-oxoguanine DNA glycosylase